MLVEHNVHSGNSLDTEGDPHGVTVLSYRNPGLEGSRLAMEAGAGQEFRRQLELLDRWGFTMITLSDCRLFFKGELHLPRRPIILTFDQGAVDLTDVVFPALSDIGGRAVVFLSTGSVTGTPSVRGAGDGFAQGLPPDQMRAMHAAGIEFGSLMCTSRRLTDLSADEVTEELVMSKERLENLLGAPVYSCAYPHGTANAAVRQLAKQAGYEFAVRGATPHTVFGTDLFDICRQSVTWITGRIGFALRVFAPHRRLIGMRRKTSLILSQETFVREAGTNR